MVDVGAATLGQRVRDLRLRAGLGQAELADRAGVSRQALGALESGRHLPRVDAALRLAAALGTTVEQLLTPDLGTPVVWDGRAAIDGPVRVAQVRDRQVLLPVSGAASGALFATPDGVVRDGTVELLPGADRDGFVVAGCDPALGVLADAGPRSGPGRLLPVVTTTGEAIEALLAGRVHAAVVHDRTPMQDPDGRHPRRLPFARWRTGVTLPSLDDLDGVLAGEVAVIHREVGAAAQSAFERAVPASTAAGPPARSHLDAAHRALSTATPAVTIEPAAASLGLLFHPFETHTVELWVAAHAVDHPGARVMTDLLQGNTFRARMAGLPAYEPIGN